MKMLDFELLCGEYMIEPALALENENIVGAIHQNDIAAVRDYLESDF